MSRLLTKDTPTYTRLPDTTLVRAGRYKQLHRNSQALLGPRFHYHFYTLNSHSSRCKSAIFNLAPGGAVPCNALRIRTNACGPFMSAPKNGQQIGSAHV